MTVIHGAIKYSLTARGKSNILYHSTTSLARCTSGTSVVGVTNHFLKLDYMKLIPDPAKVTKNLRLDWPWAYGKTSFIILLKKHSNKMMSNDILLYP